LKGQSGGNYLPLPDCQTKAAVIIRRRTASQDGVKQGRPLPAAWQLRSLSMAKKCPKNRHLYKIIL